MRCTLGLCDPERILWAVACGCIVEGGVIYKTGATYRLGAHSPWQDPASQMSQASGGGR